MLHAIGIYDCSDASAKPKRLSSAQQETGMFASNQLGPLEKNSLPSMLNNNAEEKGLAAIAIFHLENEHHYLKRVSPGSSVFLAICSKKKLEKIELISLFANIKLVHEQRVKFSLADIIHNPIGYTRKSKLVEAVTDQTAEVKLIVQQSIQKALDNGVQLKHLEDLSDVLEEESEKLLKGAKKANSCCRL